MGRGDLNHLNHRRQNSANVRSVPTSINSLGRPKNYRRTARVDMGENAGVGRVGRERDERVLLYTVNQLLYWLTPVSINWPDRNRALAGAGPENCEGRLRKKKREIGTTSSKTSLGPNVKSHPSERCGRVRTDMVPFPYYSCMQSIPHKIKQGFQWQIGEP